MSVTTKLVLWLTCIWVQLPAYFNLRPFQSTEVDRKIWPHVAFGTFGRMYQGSFSI